MTHTISSSPTNSQTNLICRLCGTTLTPQNRCKSHILPDSMVREMAGAEYGSSINVVGNSLQHRLKRKIGSRDPNILCNTCDNTILSRYDAYGIDFLRNAQVVLIPDPDAKGKLWRIDNVDQNLLKLFCLSYVWRASISILPEYHACSLGPKHEANIRAMLLSGNAGGPDDYLVAFSKFSSSNMPNGGLLFPQPFRFGKYIFYEASLPRLFKFEMKADSQPFPEFAMGALGAFPYVVVYDKGNFEASKDYQHMLNVVRNDALKSGKLKP